MSLALRTVAAFTSLEIEVGVSGTYVPGYAGDRTDPPQLDSWEDIEVETLSGLRRVADPTGKWKWQTTSLMNGVDVRNPEVRKLLANIRDFLAMEDIETALRAEVSE